MLQKTIKIPISFEGISCSTGRHLKVNLLPGEVNEGIVFFRLDLNEAIPALSKFVQDFNGQLILEKGTARVMHVGLLMASLYFLGIDNLRIELSAEEFPSNYSSTFSIVDLIIEAGIKEQSKDKKYYVLDETITLQEDGCEIVAFPCEQLQVTTLLDHDVSVFKQRDCQREQLRFLKKSFSASSFKFHKQYGNGFETKLAHDHSPNKAVDECDQISILTTANKLHTPNESDRVGCSKGVVFNSDLLQFENEASQYWFLILGAIAFLGRPLKARIIATGPYDPLNKEFIGLVYDKVRKKECHLDFPKFNPNTPPVKSITDIMELIPHRPPFLLIDKIIALTDSTITGVKCVTMNERFFVGHFPGSPVMPGVLQLEAMAQCGGILALSKVSEPLKYKTFLIKIENVKFKQRVLPGDTLVFFLSMPSPARRGIFSMTAKAFVGQNLVSQAELIGQIIKIKSV